jgi:hypothetical protein
MEHKANKRGSNQETNEIERDREKAMKACR